MSLRGQGRRLRCAGTPPRSHCLRCIPVIGPPAVPTLLAGPPIRRKSHDSYRPNLHPGSKNKHTSEIRSIQIRNWRMLRERTKQEINEKLIIKTKRPKL